MMKISFLLFASIVASLICSGCNKPLQEQGTVQPGQEQRVESDTWDFSTVTEGKKYVHAFIFKNNSDTYLNIKDVSTSCGCAVSNIKKKKLAPGEMTELAVTFDSTGYEGAVTQFIYVRTDSLDKPIVRFIIKAFVVR